ncbi:MAG: hypothetical protein H6887_09350 [Hoeflea sp.]|nr:hypothetical protein [Hoeflea sp.]
MTRSLFRRLDDALCAFATGHSRRDLDRVRRRRVWCLAERLALWHEKRAVGASDWFAEERRSRAAALRGGAQDFLHGLDGPRLRGLSQLLFIDGICKENVWKADLAERLGFECYSEIPPNLLEGIGLKPGKYPHDLTQGLFEYEGFCFGPEELHPNRIYRHRDSFLFWWRGVRETIRARVEDVKARFRRSFRAAALAFFSASTGPP